MLWLVADGQGHLICPFLMDEGRATWPVPQSPREGLGKRKERKENIFMERMSKLPFFSSVQLISCSGLLLISKRVSQPGVKDSLKKRNKMNIKST